MSLVFIFLGVYIVATVALFGWLYFHPRARFVAAVQRDLAKLPVAEPDRVLS